MEIKNEFEYKRNYYGRGNEVSIVLLVIQEFCK